VISKSGILNRFRRSTLSGGIAANAYAQAVQVVIQIVAVPVLAAHWGLSAYGIWLMLFTVPSYLALSDFGFASAAANHMTVSVARGDRNAAIDTFQATRVTVLCIALLIFGICTAAVYGLSDRYLASVQEVTHGHSRQVVLLLTGYGLLSLQNGVTMAGFRSTGFYGFSTFILANIQLAEFLTAVTVVALDGGIGAAALAYFSVRLIGSAALAIALKHKVPWLPAMARPSSLSSVRMLVSPAIATMALPAAQALFLQGTVLVVGWAAGSSAVPAFTAVRTLSRLAIQLTSVVNHAIMPEFTVAVARLDHSRKARLAFLSVITSAIVLVPLFLVVVPGGKLIIRLWTHGTIQPTFGLILAMAIVMVINGFWHPISILILALNRHAHFSYHYLVAAAGSVLISYPMVRLMGPVGAGISLMLLDGFMFARVWIVAVRLDVINSRDLRMAAFESWRNFCRVVRAERQRLRSKILAMKRTD
jgi:O-antigen/teichoic acid export membrane protein